MGKIWWYVEMRNPLLLLGETLFGICRDTMSKLYSQGELAQFCHTSFEMTIITLQNDKPEYFELHVPIGRDANKNTILKQKAFKRNEGIEKIKTIGKEQIPLTGVIQFATIMEAFWAELIRAVIMKYPQKLGIVKQVSTEIIWTANTLDEVRGLAIDSLINNFSYNTPKKHANELEKILSIPVIECPVYGGYIEMKATRDIYLHNGGLANEKYVEKSGDASRALPGHVLPVDYAYFLDCFELCLQLVSWVMSELHKKWPSPEYQDYGRITGESGTSGFGCIKGENSTFK